MSLTQMQEGAKSRDPRVRRELLEVILWAGLFS
jgi:hypothetical protein